jgi:16S rRNA (guanine527-N7)-methyltransferase
LSAPSDAAARAAREILDRLLEIDAPALRASLPPGFDDAVQRFVALLLEANARLNLTRIVEPAQVARLHLLDSLAALPLLDAASPRRAIDIGSGGGVPAIVLGLARPDVSWTLVDSSRKKADALRALVADLGLRTVAVMDERAETLGQDPAHREAYDLATARACASLPVVAEYALPLLRIGGTLLAWKGTLAEAELSAGRSAAEVLGGGEPELHPTGIGALSDHRFVLAHKVGPTPLRYPRRPGQPAKRPLG